MNDAVGDDTFATSAWREQATERDVSVADFIDTFTTAIADERLDDADRAGREFAVAHFIVRGLDLHTLLAQRAGPTADLLSDDRPGLLLGLAVARLEATSDLTALIPPLRRSAARLIADVADSVVKRARNLAMAATMLMLVGEGGKAYDVACRGADLIADLPLPAGEAQARELTAAASDIAMVFILEEHYPEAGRMWVWIRSHIADPRMPSLMQADWGLAIVGVITGEVSLISRVARTIVRHRNVLAMRDADSYNPWWGLVQASRTWTALDEYRADDALDLSRFSVGAVTIPTSLAPLATAYAVALLAAGRAESAAEHLKNQRDADRIDADPRRWRRAIVVLMAASLRGMDVTENLASPALSADPEIASVARGWVGILQGRTELLDRILEEPTAPLRPRVDALGAIVRAAAHRRRGNEAEALRALQRVASLHDTHKCTGWALLLPNEDIQGLRSLLFAAGKENLVSALPERTEIIAAAAPIEFTEREREVLVLLQLGRTNAQIAADLYISPNTVKFHVANILKRLGVTSREAAAASAVVVAPTRSTHPGRFIG